MNKNIFIALIFLCIFNKYTEAIQCTDNIGGAFYLSEGLCAWKFASGYTKPRQLITLPNNTGVLVIQGNSVTLMKDINNDGVIGSGESFVLATSPQLTHSVAYEDGYIYASSQSQVIRWAYTLGGTSILGTGQVVITGIPTGGHSTRTVVFDSDGVLYFSIGSNENVDPNYSRAKVVKCSGIDLSDIPSGGYQLSQCQDFAVGLRNEVGLRFSPQGKLWGVENGMDNAVRNDMTPKDIHLDNPCEEVNILEADKFYGYPYCFSEGILPQGIALGNGTQWAVQQFINGTINDTYCRESSVIKPVYCMPAHAAPLDLLFHNTSTLPEPFKTGLFVGHHGSWNRDPPSGYQIVHIQIDPTSNLPVQGSMKKVIGAKTDGTKWATRPVSLAKLSPCGPIAECIIFSSDSDGSIYAFASTIGTTASPTPSSSDDGTSISSNLTINFILLAIMFITIITMM